MKIKVRIPFILLGSGEWIAERLSHETEEKALERAQEMLDDDPVLLRRWIEAEIEVPEAIEMKVVQGTVR